MSSPACSVEVVPAAAPVFVAESDVSAVKSRLEAAQAASKLQDAQQRLAESQRLHDADVIKQAYECECAKEVHTEGGEYVKSMVFGGLDGIITTFALISAVEGGGLSGKTAIIMGFANLVADALSMGLGDFLSEKAEFQFIMSEQRRETWEMENYPDGEIAEMIEIYKKRGMSEKDSTIIIETLAKYPKLFVENMMVDELGLMPIVVGDDDTDDGTGKGSLADLEKPKANEENLDGGEPRSVSGRDLLALADSPSDNRQSLARVKKLLVKEEREMDKMAGRKGLVTFGSFILFGCLPLAAYIAFGYALNPDSYSSSAQETGSTDEDVTAFLVAFGVAALSLFCLGVAKARFTKQNKLMSGGYMVLNGTLASTVAYLIGLLFESF